MKRIARVMKNIVREERNKTRKEPTGIKFHELVSKITVVDDGKNNPLFSEMLDWIKGNRYLRIIQKKVGKK